MQPELLRIVSRYHYDCYDNSYYCCNCYDYEHSYRQNNNFLFTGRPSVEKQLLKFNHVVQRNYTSNAREQITNKNDLLTYAREDSPVGRTQIQGVVRHIPAH